MNRAVVTKVLMGGLLILAVGGGAYAWGWHAGRRASAAAAAQPVQFTPPPLAAPLTPFAPRPFQEFIPLPTPGQPQQPGRPNQKQDECEPIILFYHQGRLYRLQPGPGQQGPGRPGSPPEFFPLRPYQGPSIPGLPFPNTPQEPGFRPTTPRF